MKVLCPVCQTVLERHDGLVNYIVAEVKNRENKIFFMTSGADRIFCPSCNSLVPTLEVFTIYDMVQPRLNEIVNTFFKVKNCLCKVAEEESLFVGRRSEVIEDLAININVN
jgi:hypothetical protein